MPRFDFRCVTCGHQFEVSRRFGESTSEAVCPIDGADAARVYTTPPMIFTDPRGASTPSLPSPGPGPSHHGHSHGHGHGHSHGPGTAPHSH